MVHRANESPRHDLSLVEHQLGQAIDYIVQDLVPLTQPHADDPLPAQHQALDSMNE